MLYEHLPPDLHPDDARDAIDFVDELVGRGWPLANIQHAIRQVYFSDIDDAAWSHLAPVVAEMARASTAASTATPAPAPATPPPAPAPAPAPEPPAPPTIHRVKRPKLRKSGHLLGKHLQDGQREIVDRLSADLALHWPVLAITVQETRRVLSADVVSQLLSEALVDAGFRRFGPVRLPRGVGTQTALLLPAAPDGPDRNWVVAEIRRLPFQDKLSSFLHSARQADERPD